MENELFDSAVRQKGDLAGVFEYDGATGYFYLYDVSEKEGHKILDSIHVLSGDSDLIEEEVSVHWDDREQRVGLFLQGVQWAVFNTTTGAKHGGNFQPGKKPLIPPEDSFNT